MVIDTTSREGMESSLAHLMGVSVPELYQYIEAAADSAIEGQWCFNQALFDKATSTAEIHVIYMITIIRYFDLRMTITLL